jgi:hypothetical protein
MDIPVRKEDLELLIQQQVQESLHLDYKGSTSLSKSGQKEIPKDVSAFANSDGGVIIYGIEESGHLPVRVDGGVSNSVITREWIEQTILSNISPRIDGIQIQQIPIDPNMSAYCISIPKSDRAPHQDRTNKRYYKRYNFSSVPMEDYEISDIRTRSRSVKPLARFDVEIRHGFLFMFVIENPGDIAAEKVTFEFTEALTWKEDKGPPPIIANGIEYFPPGKRYHLFYGTSPSLLGKDSKACTEFSVLISYFHPVRQKRLTETFHINLNEYLGTWPQYSEVEELTKKLEKSINELTSEVKDLKRQIEPLQSLVAPTGLKLSYTSLKNLKRLAQGSSQFEPLDPMGQDGPLFVEILGIDISIAWKIAEHFWDKRTIDGLEEMEGITAELIQKIRESFLIDS